MVVNCIMLIYGGRRIRYIAVASGTEAEANVESECNRDEVNLDEE